MQTKYDGAYLTAGCWSPTRPAVFFTTKADGTVDIWDCFTKQNEPVFSTKISDHPLTAIKVQSTAGAPGNGRHVAIGSADGTVTVVSISKSLAELQNGEKSAILGMFDREHKREKNLEKSGNTRAREKKEAAAAAKKDAFDPLADEDDATQAILKQTEAKFYKMINTAAATAATANGATKGDSKTADAAAPTNPSATTTAAAAASSS